uniref:Galanin-like peptide n=1 Tax=Sus scrofa TaxID=9823 RepID=A0A8D1UWZ7_PIG
MRTTSSQTWGMTASLSVSLSLGLSFSVQGRGGWTLNSAGYLLGPVLHPPSRAEGGGKGKTALGILDLWKAIDGLPYPQSQLASKRSLGETFAKPDSGVTFVGVPDVVPWKRIRPGTTRFQLRSLALLSGLRIQCCCELWCRLQMWLGSHIAVAVV